MADRPVEAAIWPEVERLFERARSLGPAERRSFLDAECRTDAALRERLERLLAAHDRLASHDRPTADERTELDGGPFFITSLDAVRAAELLEGVMPEPNEVGRFEVIRRLGRGGMGVIFLARDPALDRQLAVKLLPPELGADPLATRRFIEEARAASALDHPNIATVFEVGRTDDERPFIAMAYYEGETLRERLERGPLEVDEAAEIAAQIAEGLAAAHGVEIVHRDIKPENLIVTGTGLVKILDFGVARTASAALTRTGGTVGTVAYMSPEQTRGERVDGRADLWALGVVLYEMLTGKRPFRADAHDAVIYAIRNDAPEPVRSLRPEAPQALAEIVERCLAKDPDERIASAAELARVLRAAVSETAGAGATGTAPGGGPWSAAWRIGLPVLLYVAIVGPAQQVIGALTPALGLPVWAPGAALGLAVAGLVLLLLSVSGIARILWPAKRPPYGRTAPVDGPARSSTTHALAAAALAVLVLVAVGAGFGALRAVDFGPISTLAARGVIDDREPVVLADFAAAASDPTIGRAVTEALRIDLLQSPTVRLAEPGEVVSALWRMGRDPVAGLTEDAARELAVREGYKAYIAGEVGALGGGYVLSARVVAAEDGATLVALRETARDSTGLIAAVDRLSKRVRERMGEPLRALHGADPLPRVATASLPALRRYAEAFSLAWAGGDDARIAALLEESVALDSTFASAYRGLAMTYRNMRADHGRTVAAITRAHELRDRLPDGERILVESAYHWQTWADPERTLEALRRVLAHSPDDLTSRANLGLALLFMGRFEEAEAVLREGDRPGAPTVIPVNLAQALYFRGRTEEALAILDSLSTAPDGSRAPNPFAENLRARLLGAEERWDEAEWVALDILDRIPDSPHARSEASRALWHLALVQGRIEEAERYFQTMIESYERIGALDALARAHIQRADTRLTLLDDTAGARAALDELLDRPGFDPFTVGPTLAPRAAAVLAGIGDAASATRLLDEWEALPIGLRSEPDGFSPEIARARIDLAADRPLEAIAHLEGEESNGLQAINLLPDLGRAYHEAGQLEAAIDALERYLEFRHVRRLHRIPGRLGPVLIRLADLYEATGDTEKAREMHARLAALWQAADPALREQAERASRRVAELSEPRSP